MQSDKVGPRVPFFEGFPLTRRRKPSGFRHRAIGKWIKIGTHDCGGAKGQFSSEEPGVGGNILGTDWKKIALSRFSCFGRNLKDEGRISVRQVESSMPGTGHQVVKRMATQVKYGNKNGAGQSTK